MSKSRSYCFTCYSIERFAELMNIEHRYIVIGREICPKTNRKHLQGYIYFENPRSFKAVKKLFGNAHIERCAGTAEENRNYCIKGGDFEEDGELPSPGKRNDILGLREAIFSGKREIDIIKDDNLCPVMGRYLKFADRMREVYERERSKNFREVEVFVLYGPAGAGKTSYVYANEDTNEIYTLVQAQKEIWFDGYCHEKILLIDDFYGWIKWGFMLKLLEGHPCRLNKKGATGWACWNKVYITSNKPPWEWYQIGYPMELQRRIKNIIYFSKTGTEVRGNTMPEPTNWEVRNFN